MALTKQVFGHCGTGDCACAAAPNCNVFVTVNGCSASGLKLPGAVVTIWTDATKTTLLGSGATNSFGSATIPIAATPTWYWECSHPTGRLATVSGTASCGGGFSILTISLTTPTAGYHCSAFCALPLADTLYYHDAFNGAVTLNWSSGTTWTGSTGTNFPGCTNPPGFNNCTARIGFPVTVLFNSAVDISYTRDANGCAAPSIAFKHCNAPRTTTVCPPALYLEFTAQLSCVDACSDPSSGATLVGTVTE